MILQTLGPWPPTVAAYLVLRGSGNRGIIAWIGKRYAIWRLHRGWYLTAAFLPPTITLVSVGLRSLADPGYQLAPHSPLGEMAANIGLIGTVLLLPLLVLGQPPSSPLLEEFGWRGFALPLLQARWSALSSSVMLGVVWGLWHLPLMFAYGEPLIPYLLLIVPQTVLMTWVVNGAKGSMLLAMLFTPGSTPP